MTAREALAWMSLIVVLPGVLLYLLIVGDDDKVGA